MTPKEVKLYQNGTVNNSKYNNRLNPKFSTHVRCMQLHYLN